MQFLSLNLRKSNIFDRFKYFNIITYIKVIIGVIKMPRVTVSVPDELLKRFKKTFPEVNVAAVARRVIFDKIKELEKLEELKAKGVI